VIHDLQEDTDVKCHLRRVYTHDLAEALLQNVSMHSVTPAVKRLVFLTILNLIPLFGQAKIKHNIQTCKIPKLLRLYRRQDDYLYQKLIVNH